KHTRPRIAKKSRGGRPFGASLKLEIWRLAGFLPNLPPLTHLRSLAPFAVAAATAAATAIATATAGRAFFAGTRFVDGQGTALEILLMKHGNRLVGVFLRPHFNEGKAAGTTRRAILHDVDSDDRSRLREVVLQVVFGRVKG